MLQPSAPQVRFERIADHAEQGRDRRDKRCADTTCKKSVAKSDLSCVSALLQHSFTELAVGALRSVMGQMNDWVAAAASK